ncbi:MAG TPA: ABC transporter substrate-binding protein [Acetobacteraceae bacterium]|jgi:peptide/nickel transport system substrate-binding protein|nr:ABC transporter substrate-binding protein [Acetobacteraceae bacterium]
MRLGARITLCAALTVCALPAFGQTLKVAVSSPVTSIDPHYHNLAPNISLSTQIFNRLIEMDEHAHLVPGLATSWKLVAPDTWELKLRDAKFQNGNAFTADDVVFTMERIPKVPNSPSNFAAYTKPVASTEVVDEHTIRLLTNGVFPLLPTYLAQFFIINRKSDEGLGTEDFNSGKAAIGTGPFRFVSYKPGDRIELERNDTYWGPKPPWQHVEYRFISNDASRTAALLAGDVDFIDFVPTEDLEKLRKDPKVKLWETVGTRLIFLGLDQSRDGPSPFVFGPNGEKLDKNPLKDPRVRKALSLAINRKAIVDRVMEDAAVPSGQYLPPGVYSYAPDIKPPPYEPEEAKKLLAEAGYPKGLHIALHGPNDRYVNDAKIIQAVGQMWTRIGVQTEVDPLPWTSFVGQANKQAFSAFLFGWGTGTAEASDPLIAQNATFNPTKGWGAANRGRYSNPDVDKLIEQALGTADDAAREKVLQQAQKVVFDDTALIPLHIQKNIWATRTGLTYVPTVGEDLHLVDVRPAK